MRFLTDTNDSGNTYGRVSQNVKNNYPTQALISKFFQPALFAFAPPLNLYGGYAGLLLQRQPAGLMT